MLGIGLVGCTRPLVGKRGAECQLKNDSSQGIWETSGIGPLVVRTPVWGSSIQ